MVNILEQVNDWGRDVKRTSWNLKQPRGAVSVMAP